MADSSCGGFWTDSPQAKIRNRFSEKLMQFWAYVLKSARDGTCYTGSAQNVEERLKQHNEGNCRYTKGYRPWEVVYVEPAKSRSIAVKRERFLKTGAGRKELESVLSAK